MGIERPFERERIHPNAVSAVLFLKDEEGRNRINGIFQPASKKTWAMRRRENQTIAQTDIPNTVARLTAVGAVASASPNLHFMLAFDRACLRVS